MIAFSSASPDSPGRGHPRVRGPAAHPQPGSGDATEAPEERARDAGALPGQVLRPQLPDHEEVRHAPAAGQYTYGNPADACENNPGGPPCLNGDNLLAPVGAVSTIPPLRGFIASRIHVICIIHARVKSTEKNVLANVFRREIIALDFHVDYSPCSTTI